MAFGIVAETLARIEHKIDVVISLLKFLDPKNTVTMMPMHFTGHSCPLCAQKVDYTVDITHGVVVRRCGCKTGKQPPLIPLIPVPGTTNGSAASESRTAGAGQSPEEPNGPRRQKR